MIELIGSYVTVHSPVTALAAAPSDPLLAQEVIAQPVTLQFFPPSALTQNVIPVTPPGALTRVAVPTELVDVAVLLAVLESPGLDIATLNVTVAGAAGSGTTGIRKVSLARDARVIVLVQVTVTPTVVPHDHPLSTNGLVGPDILAGRVRIAVCTRDDVRLPALVRVIGI